MALPSVSSHASPSSSPQQTLSSIDKLMQQLDEEVAKKTTGEVAKFDDICALVNQILALMQANQKRLTSDLSKLHAKAREHHHNQAQKAHCGHSVTLCTIASVSLHALAGLSHVSPGATFKGGEAINNAVSSMSNGKLSGIFDLARFSNTPEGHAGIAQAASSAFGGFAQAAGGMQSIAGDKRQSNLQEHSTRSDHAKSDKQELDQEVSAATNRTDSAINAAKDHEEKRHRAMQAIMGG